MTIPFRFGRVAGAWTVVAMTWAAGVRAAESPAEELLKGRGLLRSSSLYVLEDETLVKTKLYDAQSTFEPFAAAFKQQVVFERAEQQLKVLEQQRIETRRRIDDLGVAMSRFPIPRFRNNMDWDAYNQLRNEQNLLQLSINEVNSNRGTLNNQMPTFQQKEEIKAEVKRRRGPFLDSIRKLRELVDATLEKYQTLAEDDEVKDALVTLGRASKVQLKLGPSSEFRAAVKELEKAEKMIRPGSLKAPDSPSRKTSPSRKSRR
jgi:hypothetical protein